jgi:hypothetical protein
MPARPQMSLPQFVRLQAFSHLLLGNQSASLVQQEAHAHQQVQQHVQVAITQHKEWVLALRLVLGILLQTYIALIMPALVVLTQILREPLVVIYAPLENHALALVVPHQAALLRLFHL